MTLRAALHLALCFLLLSALAGCAGLPFRDDAEQDAQTAPKRPPQFRLTVDAPSRLQALLLQHLDLARLQYAAEADALTRTEIDRLIGAAAAQAESLLNTVGQRFGNRRLKQVLQAKELPAELVASTLEQAAATELQRAREVWKRKYGEPAKDAAERVRQARFLASRGFSSEVITRVVRGLDEA